jgi:hypothetical protein
MLQGNFATEKVTSLKIEANLVEPAAFLPQRNKVFVNQELLSKVKATSENVMDFTSSHKTNRKTAIVCIGTMHSMVDFSSLCINMDMITTTICSNDEPQPILHQILLNFVAIVNNPDCVHWSDNVSSMPLLHWYYYSFLKQIINCFADFATDFGNGNIMSEAHPITELNTSTPKSALTVLKTFCYQINLHQATMTAITVMPGSVTAYTVNPWNNTQASKLRIDERNSPMDGASPPTSNATFKPDQHNGGKRDPTTPDKNEDNPSGHQRQKKPCRGVKVDNAAKEKQDLGMFYLRNPFINPADIFPRDMPEKLCANFTCKRKECNNTRLVLILAGAVCNIWDFFLVNSYMRVGLYLCSTVNYCRPALKKQENKKMLRNGYKKNSYRPILWKIVIQNRAMSKFYVTPIFFVKPNWKSWAPSGTASAAARGSLPHVPAQ